MARRTEVFIIFMLKCLQAFLCVTVSTLFVDGAYLDDGKRQIEFTNGFCCCILFDFRVNSS